MKIYCPKCGYDSPFFHCGTDYFCAVCGAKLSPDAYDKAKLSTLRNMAKYRHMSAYTVLVLFAIAMACAFYAIYMAYATKVVVWWLMVALYWVTLTVKNWFDWRGVHE